MYEYNLPRIIFFPLTAPMICLLVVYPSLIMTD